MALAELQTERVGKSVLDKPCFIISPMGQTSSPVRKRAEEIFKNYIEPVCKATGYFPVRSGPTLGGSIINGITNALNCAPMTIAYLGGLPWNPNVMIEVGYRLNTNLPLVYLCDQDDSGNDLPLPFHFQGQWVVSLPVSGVDSGKIEALDRGDPCLGEGAPTPGMAPSHRADQRQGPRHDLGRQLALHRRLGIRGGVVRHRRSACGAYHGGVPTRRQEADAARAVPRVQRQPAAGEEGPPGPDDERVQRARGRQHPVGLRPPRDRKIQRPGVPADPPPGLHAREQGLVQHEGSSIST